MTNLGRSICLVTNQVWEVCNDDHPEPQYTQAMEECSQGIFSSTLLFQGSIGRNCSALEPVRCDQQEYKMQNSTEGDEVATNAM